MIRFAPLLLLAVVALAGCTGNRLDVQQGNNLDPEDVAAVEIGMNRTQVQEILGTPVLESPFRANRWDYVYYRGEAGLAVRETPRRLTIHFEDDQVSEIEDRYTKTAGNGTSDANDD